ncbi:HAMP domain-containing sensor histidine kinase [Paraburkholderia sp.]|uniref:sensor histidine kinase n=1 Tax=Paraburkholderia sp. TaxID=1926495 RepID=UPI00286F8397|nr:HAMP domain-containing sensor histidine kinase [Paraburkholderia sp.]
MNLSDWNWVAGRPGAFVPQAPRTGAAQAAIGHDRWQTTTFRWFAAYAAIFSVSFMVLLGFIEFSVTRAMIRETDTGLRWQLRYFDSRGDDALAAAIDTRLHRENQRQNFYGLFAPDGRWLAGDIHSLPAGLTLDPWGRSHEHARGQTVRLDTGMAVPALRAMGEVRADGARIVVARSLTDVHHVHDELLKALFGGGLLCLCGSLCAGLLLSMRQIRRVAEIRRATGRIAGGELGERLPVAGRDELDMLADLVNRMLDEVERLMAEVKSACDGIAHDLRTPLTRLRLRLSHAAESMQRRGEPAIANVLVDARNEADTVLERFAALLRISEIGAIKRRSGFAQVALPALVDELCDLYAPLAEEKAVELRIAVAEVAPIHADRALLFEAFSNLLDNAIKFAPRGGVVGVTLRVRHGGPRFSVTDNGPGIAPGERDAVLGRYYRSEAARHVPGTGLGLGIVAAVMRLHDFRLSIDDADPQALSVSTATVISTTTSTVTPAASAPACAASAMPTGTATPPTATTTPGTTVAIDCWPFHGWPNTRYQ